MQRDLCWMLFWSFNTLSWKLRIRTNGGKSLLDWVLDVKSIPWHPMSKLNLNYVQKCYLEFWHILLMPSADFPYTVAWGDCGSWKD